MIAHEAAFVAPEIFSANILERFKPEAKYAGWIQGAHGRSVPVLRQATRRVAESYELDEKGRHAIKISEYYSLQPHDRPLRLVPGEVVEGVEGQEVKVTYKMPVEKANRLSYSQSMIAVVTEEIPLGRISAVTR